VAAATLALALSGAALAPGTAAADSTVHLPRPARAVALGDSYASGEGLAPYRAGTDTATNRCHRSPQAYPELLAADGPARFHRLRSVACSGATTAALLMPQAGTDVRAQVRALSRRTKTVTLTVGGSDIGFAPVLRSCTYAPVDLPEVKALVPGAPGCEARLDARMTAPAARLAGRAGTAAQFPATATLPQALRAIHRRAPHARIYVTGYPRLFGLSFDARTGCQVGQLGQVPLLVSPGDVRWIRAKVDGLNAAIASSVEQARSRGVRARYVDVATPFTGHNLCSAGTPWLNGVVVAPTNPPQVSQASFHPNARGQQAFADAVAAAGPGRRG